MKRSLAHTTNRIYTYIILTWTNDIIVNKLFMLQKKCIVFLYFFIAASFLEDSVGYYTETLHKSLKGFRSNDRVVINIIISRMEVYSKMFF